MTRAPIWLVAIAAAYLYIFPYFPKIHSANELPRIYLTRAMVQEGTVHIDTDVARWGGTADVSPSRGHQYSNKAPGSSMLAAPAYAIVRAVAGDPGLAVSTWICRVAAGIAPAIAFLWLLWGWLARFAPDPHVRRLVLVAYALGSMAMIYSLLFYSHQLGAACAGTAFILALDVSERRRGLRAMAAAGACAGAALLVDYQAVFATVPVAALVVVRIWRWPARDTMRTLGAAAAGAAIPVAALLLYHSIAFGSPWRTGYDASETFAVYHQQGFLGITELRWEAFTGSMVRPDNGLVILAPWLLLAIPGAVVLARKGERAVVTTCGAVVVIYLLFISSINFWRGGWQIGPRYITAMLPFLLPPIAALLEAWKDRDYAIGSAAGLIVAGVGVYALTAATFPYWPETLKNPVVECTFGLLADNRVAPSLGSAIGLSGIAGMLPYFALVGGVVGVALVRAARPKGAAIAVGIGVALLAAFALLPRTADHERERVMTFVHQAMDS